MSSYDAHDPPEHNSANALATVPARAGFLGVYIGLYGAAWTTFVQFLLPGDVDAALVAFAGVLTAGVYLLDRVKPIDAMIDPADADAHPARHAFIHRHRRFLRGVCVVFALSLLVWSALLNALLPLLVIASHVGVLIYGSLPRRPRVKDVYIVKNLAVAVAFAAMLFALVWVRDQHIETLAGLGLLLAFVSVHIFLDAMVCDIDDAAADEMHGTQTVVNRSSVQSVWLLALVGNMAAGAGLIGGAMRIAAIDHRAAALFAASLMLGMIVVRSLHMGKIRDVIDIKAPTAIALAYVASILLL